MNKEKEGKEVKEKAINSDDSDNEAPEEHTNTMNMNANQTTTSQSNASGLLSKRPIIFICNDPYSKGLRPLKKYCHIFKAEKDPQALSMRVKEVAEIEGISLDREVVNQIIKGFDSDIAGCMGFLDILGLHKARGLGGCLPKNKILALLKAASTAESQKKGYIETIKSIFNKAPDEARFKSGEENAKKIYQSVLQNLEPLQLLDGIVMNYFQCDQILHNINSVAELLYSLTRGYQNYQLIRKSQLYALERHIALPALYAYSNFFKKDWMRINYTSEVSSLRFESKKAEKVFTEMRNSLPPICQAFNSVKDYREDLNFIYEIIQPSIESNFLGPEEKKMIQDTILIMLQNGISFASSSNPSFLTNSKGNSRKALYEPLFEKYLMNGDSFPRVTLSDLALRQLQSNFQYMRHVYEAGGTSFVSCFLSRI